MKDIITPPEECLAVPFLLFAEDYETEAFIHGLRYFYPNRSLPGVLQNPSTSKEILKRVLDSSKEFKERFITAIFSAVLGNSIPAYREHQDPWTSEIDVFGTPDGIMTYYRVNDLRQVYVNSPIMSVDLSMQVTHRNEMITSQINAGLNEIFEQAVVRIMIRALDVCNLYVVNGWKPPAFGPGALADGPT